ncbi:MAG: methyltransferase domain-containing protein [Pseudomonadota bacterium]
MRSNADKNALRQDKEAEKRFFNEFASEQEYDVFHDKGYRRLMREFSARVDPLPGEAFLDIGCGTAAFTEYLVGAGLVGTGLDISMSNLRLAAKKLPATSFIAGDAECLPFREETFDIVALSGVLHHLPNFSGAMAESFRILRPGGRFFAFDPNGRNPVMWVYRSTDSPVGSRKGLTDNERLIRGEEIEAGLKPAGFIDVVSIGVSGITYKYVRSKFAARLLGLYNALDACLDHTPFRSGFGSFLVSFGRKPQAESDDLDGAVPLVPRRPDSRHGGTYSTIVRDAERDEKARAEKPSGPLRRSVG